jgi:hypothetical protein
VEADLQREDPYLARQLSVRKVAPTLTSKSTEIYPSMAGPKQLGDRSFILVLAGAVHPAGMCSGHCIALHRGACRGVLSTHPPVTPVSDHPPVSLWSFVSQALELAYKRRSNKSPDATTLEAAPGWTQDPSRRLPEARFARTDVNSTALYAMLPHAALRATRRDCKPPPCSIKGGGDPLAVGDDDGQQLTRISAFTYDIGT